MNWKSDLALASARRQQRLPAIGKLERPSVVSRRARFRFHAGISIGRYSRIGPDCLVDGEGGVAIGPGTILAPKVTILSSTHEWERAETLPYGPSNSLRPVSIGAGCWLGWGAMVCPGASIGDGAVVAMGSVVSGDVGDGEVVGGNPAVVLKRRPPGFERQLESEDFYLRRVIESGVFRPERGRAELQDLITDS